MNFDLSSDQKLLLETAASFVKKESPTTRLRSLRDDPVGWTKPMWKKMGELGWLGMPLREEDGGFGGSFVDAALLLEQFGTTLVPEPYVASVVLAGMTIAAAGTPEQKKAWLEPMIAGDESLALAYAERESRSDVGAVKTRATKDGDGFRLQGEKVFVLNGHAADRIVVSARTSGGERDRDGVSLFVVDRDAPGLGVRTVPTMDGHRAGLLACDGVKVSRDRLLGPEGGAYGLLEEAMDRGAAAACAEGAGLMRAVLAMTVSYLNTREQFGVKIGTFQALQHRAVDMFVETELAKSTAMMAMIKVADADADERRSAISAAKVQLAVAGRFVTQQATQLHGGIGVTDEHDVGLYFKRMHVLNTLFGDEEHHVARFASLPTFTASLAG